MASNICCYRLMILTHSHTPILEMLSHLKRMIKTATNLSRASRKCSFGISKWKFVYVEAVKALLLPPLSPR